MPVTITDPVFGAPFGPGFSVRGFTSTVPINPPSAEWRAVLWDADHVLQSCTGRFLFENQAFGFTMGEDYIDHQLQLFGITQSLTSSKTGHLDVTLSDSTGTIDTGTQQVVIDQTSGQAALLPFVQSEGQALTPIQAQQLDQVHGSTFLSISLDAMLLQEITSGPQGGVVSQNLGVWIYGVIVRIAQVPPQYRVNTADGNYWSKSLAVVRIYRGADLWKRVPVHTSSKLVSFVEEGLVSAVAALLPLQWLLQISIQVSFAPGVTGQVFLMTQP